MTKKRSKRTRSKRKHQHEERQVHQRMQARKAGAHWLSPHKKHFDKFTTKQVGSKLISWQRVSRRHRMQRERRNFLGSCHL